MSSLRLRVAAAAFLLAAASSCRDGPDGASSDPGTSDRSDATVAMIAGDPRAEEVRSWYIRELAELGAGVDALADRVAARAETAELHRTFKEARDRYKRVEFLVEYYSATAAGEINGPPIPEVHEDDPNRFVHPPEGFQVIEEALYPELGADDIEVVVNEVRILRSTIRRVEQLTRASAFGDPQVWEAARQEVIRIATLGVSGFDSPVALRSIPEAASAFEGLAAALSLYDEAPRPDALLTELEQTGSALRAHPDFNPFDRVAFFRERIPAVLAAMRDARLALGVDVSREPQAIAAHVTNLFATDALDPHYFAPLGAPRPSAAEVELGQRLFREPALSGNGDRSCATCHVPELAFTDGLDRSAPLSPGGAPLRNAPTVINAGLQVGSFYDLRTEFLEDQISDVVRNPQEMHGDLDEAAARIASDPGYRSLLREVAGQPATAGPAPRPAARSDGDLARLADAPLIRRALASYMRSLSSMDSRFDRYMRGEDVSVSASELRGFNVFMGSAGCGTCHFAPLFNGTVPPAYRKTEVEILGVPEDPAGERLRIDPDPGRYALYGVETHRHAFKTTTVRNAAVTAPYMHNGAYETLEEVVDFYNAGGGIGLGIEVEHQTLPPDSLHLSEADVRDLVAFIEALTDVPQESGAPVPATPEPARLGSGGS